MDNTFPLIASLNEVMHDIESYSDYFCTTVCSVDGKLSITFELNPYQYRNDLMLMCDLYEQFSSRGVTIISFNGVNFDSPVMRFILEQKAEFAALAATDLTLVTRAIKNFVDCIINSEAWFRISDFSKYRKGGWVDIDLYLYWSRLLRMSKGISLKALGIQLNFPVTQDLPVDPNSPVGPHRTELVRTYNSQFDMGIMTYLMTKPFYWYGKKTYFREMIDLRKAAIEEFSLGQEVLSYDPVKLGLAIAMVKHKELNPSFDPETMEGASGFNVKLSSIISDIIDFKPGPEDITPLKTPHSYKVSSPHGLLKHLRSRTVYTTEEINYQLRIGDTKYDIKSGGLHTHNKTCVVEPLPGCEIIDVDVSGYYPSLGSVLDASPKHVPNFGNTLRWMRNTRVELKHQGLGKSPRANLLKLSANGTVGNYNQPKSPIYSPDSFLKITINGQLLLLMLIERTLSAIDGASVIMANTDGATFQIPVQDKELFIEICKNFETETDLELEYAYYSKIFIEHVNSYLAISTDGSIKKKGTFVTDPDLGNSCDFLVIPRALEANLVHGVPVDTFLRSPERNIFEFCGSQKVGKQFHVRWRGEIQPQRLNRYYVATNGSAMYKVKNGKNQAIPGLKGQLIMLYNVHKEAPMKEYNIDYAYYRRQVDAILSALMPQKLTLF